MPTPQNVMGPWALPLFGYAFTEKTIEPVPHTAFSLPISGLVSDITVAVSLPMAHAKIEFSLTLSDFEAEVT